MAFMTLVHKGAWEVGSFNVNPHIHSSLAGLSTDSASVALRIGWEKLCVIIELILAFNIFLP